MINDTARLAVEQSTCGRAGQLRRPLYDSYGFARLPATLEYLLTGDESARQHGLPADVLGPLARRWEVVLHVVVDGFGWHLFQHYAERFPFLKRFVDHGLVSPLTAQFPSTTAAHMTTLHTGLPVGQHGVHEWFYHEPAAGTVIAPLLWAIASDWGRETLGARGVTPQAVFPPPCFYQGLAEAGVACSVFQDAKYAHSTYSTALFGPAERLDYLTLSAGLDRMAERLAVNAGPRYVFFYIDGIDACSHSHGLGTPEFEAQVEATFSRLEELLWGRLAGKPGDALLVMSADHGQVAVDPLTTTYVNLLIPDLPRMLQTSRTGELLRFGGSGRDLFLYAKPECLDELEGHLVALMGERGEVARTEELIAQGFFGPPPCDRLRERVGNLVVLPYAGQSAFWFEEGRFWMKHKGSHGGLTPQEMDTGVYLLPL
jgi:hypothetical protein